MHVYYEKDLVEIKVKDIVLLISCVFSKRKLMHAVKDLILEDCAVLEGYHPLGKGESSQRNNARK